MKQKIAIVTGASSGLGHAICHQLEQQGYYVYACARRASILEKLRSQNIEPLTLDVTKDSQCQDAIQHIIESKGTVDLLINNAGFGLYSTIEDANIEAVQYQFDVNLFGIIRLTQKVLPYMRKKQSGRIINISSVVGQISMPIIGYYAASKHAVEAFSDALRMEVQQFGIDVVIVEPGAIKTGFEQIAFESLKKSHKTRAYDRLVKKMQDFSVDMFAKAPAAECINKSIKHAISSKKPKKRYQVGKDAKALLFIKRFLGYAALDPILTRALGAHKK